MSLFSSILFFLAFRLTSVRLIAQVSTLHTVMMIVAASTIHPPQAICGINSRISTRKASSVMRSVGKVKIKSASRNRGECDGPRKCNAAPRSVQTSVIKAATGCTTRMDERACRLSEGSVKSFVVEKIPATHLRLVDCSRFYVVTRTHRWDSQLVLVYTYPCLLQPHSTRRRQNCTRSTSPAAHCESLGSISRREEVGRMRPGRKG